MAVTTLNWANVESRFLKQIRPRFKIRFSRKAIVARKIPFLKLMLDFTPAEVMSMNLKHLTDHQLLEGTKDSVGRERNSLLVVLHHLREIERRRLFSSLKYSSLLAYCVEELNYSEPEAIRRISAMRLLRDLPHVESKVRAGSLTLTNLVLAQTLFSKEK
jgi:hypothetical protein